MSVIFKQENHKYISADPSENIEWISVTSFVGRFKEKFDPITQSIKSSKNKRSKWYGMSPELIQEIWSRKTERAVLTGSWYHDQRESDFLALETIERQGVAIPVIKPIWENNIKIAPSQKLTEGIYPEHLVYLKSARLCGQSDRVEVVKKTVNITDYKTNEEIKKEGFVNWEGVTKKMLGPCAHLDDCNFNHYSLQLSAYMYMILKHNPTLEPGDLILQHVIFKKDGVDKYGDPILAKDNNGDPIVEDIVPYKVPYLKQEIIDMINYIKENP